MTKFSMSRQRFAEATAQAFVDQYCGGGERVMNSPVIIYNMSSGWFDTQSSLSPTFDCDVPVLKLEDGIFGDYEPENPDATYDAVLTFLADLGDDLWSEVVAKIQAARQEYMEEAGIDERDALNEYAATWRGTILEVIESTARQFGLEQAGENDTHRLYRLTDGTYATCEIDSVEGLQFDSSRHGFGGEVERFRDS